MQLEIIPFCRHKEANTPHCRRKRSRHTAPSSQKKQAHRAVVAKEASSARRNEESKATA